MRETDQPIDEVRELRRRISARFDHDPARLVAHYMKLQEEYRERLIEAPQTAEDAGQSGEDPPSPIAAPGKAYSVDKIRGKHTRARGSRMKRKA